MSRPEAFFLDRGPTGQRFCLFHAAAGGIARAQLLYLHPLAEEMNKSRRMAALQSRALAAQGFDVLQLDLFGCGDSSGDFDDASWQHWLDDAAAAVAWLRARSAARLWLWGLRSGCLLAAEAASREALDCDFLFWQPYLNGKLALQQFLRIRLAADMASGPSKGAMAALRAELAAGATVEVGGYGLTPGLAQGLEAAGLAPPPGAGRVEWLDLSPAPAAGAPAAPATPTPAATACLQQWHAAGYQTRWQQIGGPAFWQSTEIETAPALISGTLAAVAA